MIPQAEIDRLRALWAAGTPGKFFVLYGTNVMAADGNSATTLSASHFDATSRNVANAALLAAAVNALPALLDIAEAVANAPVAEIDSSGDEARLIAEGSELDNAITSARVDALHRKRVALVVLPLAGEVGE